MVELAAKQEHFFCEYMVDMNATQAAIRAGYSENTAQVQSSRPLSKYMVNARVEELQAESAKRTDVSTDAW